MKRSMILAVLLALGATASKATIFTEYVDITPMLQGASGTITFNIPQFNPTMGTLNSVGLILTPVMGDIGYSVFNSSGSTQSVTFASVSNPNGSLIDGNSLGLDATWSSAQSFQSNNFTASHGINNGSLPFSVFTLLASSVTAAPAGFTGNGTYSLPVNGSSVATSSGSPGTPLFYGWYGNVGGHLEVDYNFTPVPEPSSLALMAMCGLLFAGFLNASRRLAR